MKEIKEATKLKAPRERLLELLKINKSKTYPTNLNTELENKVKKGQ